MNPRSLTLTVGVVTLAAYAALALGYATLTPIWQNPDEPAHYNYVAFVAETGGLPTLQPGDWDSALLDRLKNGRLLPSDSVSAIRYEAWQPPLYYLAAAPLFRLGPEDDPPSEVARLRLFDVVLGGLTLGVAYLIAREVLAEQLVFAVPLAMVGNPMFTSVSAAVSADPLANLLAACALLVLVRRVRREGPRSAALHGTRLRAGECSEWRWPVGVGALLGLGLLAKLALGIFVPLALLTLALRSKRPVRDAVILLATTAVVMLPWLVHQVTAYGWTDPLATSRHASVVLDQQRFPGLSLPYLVSFFTITFHSFWAQFGWMGVVAPDRLYWVWGLLVLVAVGGLAMQRRRLVDQPGVRMVLATLGAAVIGYVGYNLTFEQFQGRYLFTALVPIAVLLVLGWAAWMPSRGRVQSIGVILIGLLLVGLNAYALLRVLVPGFAPTG